MVWPRFLLSIWNYGSNNSCLVKSVRMTESREIDLTSVAAMVAPSTPHPELLCISDGARPIFLAPGEGKRERKRDGGGAAHNNSGSKSLSKQTWWCCFPSMIIGGFVAAGKMGGSRAGAVGTTATQDERERNRGMGDG